jgi:hypothetical protein
MRAGADARQTSRHGNHTTNSSICNDPTDSKNLCKYNFPSSARLFHRMFGAMRGSAPAARCRSAMSVAPSSRAFGARRSAARRDSDQWRGVLRRRLRSRPDNCWRQESVLAIAGDTAHCRRAFPQLPGLGTAAHFAAGQPRGEHRPGTTIAAARCAQLMARQYVTKRPRRPAGDRCAPVDDPQPPRGIRPQFVRSATRSAVPGGGHAGRDRCKNAAQGSPQLARRAGADLAARVGIAARRCDIRRRSGRRFAARRRVRAERRSVERSTRSRQKCVAEEKILLGHFFCQETAPEAGYGAAPAAHTHPRRINSLTPDISSARRSCPSGVWNTRPCPYLNTKAIG